MTEEKSNDSLNEFDDLLDVKKTDLKTKEYSEVKTVKADPPDLLENTGFFNKIWNNVQSTFQSIIKPLKPVSSEEAGHVKKDIEVESELFQNLETPFPQNIKSVGESGSTEDIDEILVSNVEFEDTQIIYKNSNEEPELEFIDLAEEEIDKLIAEIENSDSQVTTTENEEVSLEINDIDEVAEEVVDVIIADFENSDNTEETIIIEQPQNGNNEHDNIAGERIYKALSGEVIEDAFSINEDEVDEIIENFDFSDISEKFTK